MFQVHSYGISFASERGEYQESRNWWGIEPWRKLSNFYTRNTGCKFTTKTRSRGQQVTTYKQHITKTIHDDAMIEEKALHDATSD